MAMLVVITVAMMPLMHIELEAMTEAIILLTCEGVDNPTVDGNQEGGRLLQWWCDGDDGEEVFSMAEKVVTMV